LRASHASFDGAEASGQRLTPDAPIINVEPNSWGDDAAMHFTGTWTTSPQPLDHPVIGNVTFRMMARTSIAGKTARVRFSNAHGDAPMKISGATIALRKGETGIEASSRRALTFGGDNAVIIAAGALVVSDPADIDLHALADIAITFHVPGTVKTSTGHGGARQTNYISPPGDHSGAADMPIGQSIDSWFFATCVEVASPATTKGIVTLGDSLTDANISTPNANYRWPDQLARRLVAERGPLFAGVMNQGIGGNRILHDNPNAHSGQRRFDRDALAQPGATHLILLLGTNDLRNRRGDPAEEANAAAMVASMTQIGIRAKAAGLKAYIGTLMPYENETFVPGCWTPAKEKVRLDVNDWIRGNKVFDAVIDFEKALQDPESLSKLLPKWDCGDHLHPSDAGYNHMGDCIDLKLFD
jgi:lysophospholipase L1-like esterase